MFIYNLWLFLQGFNHTAMKNKKIITRQIALTVSMIGIVLLMVLQFVWLRNAYKISEQNLKDKCMDCFENAISDAFFNRISKEPKTNYSSVSKLVKNDKLLTVTLIDIYTLCHGPFKAKWIDSSFLKLSKKEFGSTFKYEIYLTKRKLITQSNYQYQKDDNLSEITLTEKDLKKIIDSTYTYVKRPISSKTNRITLTKQLNSCQDINLEIINPAAILLKQARYVLFISIFIVVLIASILVYLLNSALRENRFVRFIKEYTHALTHDLRSPLNSIHLASSTLYQEGDSLESKKAKDYLRICKDQSKNMLDSIDRILTVAKTEQTELIVNKKPLPIKPYLQEITRKFVEDNIHVKPIVVEVACEQDDLEASIDSVLMGSVLNNLMDNAVKYSYDSVAITIKAYLQGNTIHIRIKDDGMGIPANDLEAIFEHFNQGSLLERKRMFGYGIGLSFIKQVVQSHGGHIEVTSKVMEGSEFIIVLPA